MLGGAPALGAAPERALDMQPTCLSRGPPARASLWRAVRGAEAGRVRDSRNAQIGRTSNVRTYCTRCCKRVYSYIYRWLAPWRVCAHQGVWMSFWGLSRAQCTNVRQLQTCKTTTRDRARALRQITAQHDQAARATTHTRERQRDRPTERLTRPTAARPLHDRPSEMLPDAVQTLTLTSRALAHTHTSMFATSCRRACALSRRTTRGTPLCPRATRQAGPTSEAGTTTTIGIPKKAAPPSDAGKRPGS